MAFLLDTDILTLLLNRTQPFYDRIKAQMDEHGQDKVFTSIVSFQEHIQGWMAYLHKARSDDRILFAYDQLQKILQDYADSNVMRFDSAALSQFHLLRKQYRRMGTLDRRIASIALAKAFTLVTRNLGDFRALGGLQVEDWTK